MDISGRANAQQADYWTAVGGVHWVAEQRQFDHMLAAFGAESRRVLDAQPGEHVLDVGCGTATSTLAIAHAVGPSGSVVGCDISPTMIDAARVRAASLDNVSFAIADAQTDDLNQAHAFDAVYSRFGVMFFADPVAAFVNIAKAVRPGGRLVFVCWQREDANEWIAAPARIMRSFAPAPVLPPADMPGPFAFGDAARIESILGEARWRNVAVRPFTARVQMGGGDGIDPALQQSMGTRAAQGLREQVDEATFERATAAVRDVLAEHLTESGAVEFDGAVWIVTATLP
ncbi:MAG: SAM-dependent methyltransferase [Ilumatobacteraceae bacterium]|nr:SAM-dependent methyltransferase [Ilumatobacteraceae bacterium]